LKFGLVDITTETTIYNQFNVEKFPSLFMIRKIDGKLKDLVSYNNDMGYEGM